MELKVSILNALSNHLSLVPQTGTNTLGLFMRLKLNSSGAA